MMKLKKNKLKPETFEEKYRRVVGRNYISHDIKRKEKDEVLKSLLNDLIKLLPFPGIFMTGSEQEKLIELKNKILENMDR